MVKVFSIKKEYSNKIFEKEKLIEYRRQKIKIKKNEICLIYTTSPVKAITGYFVVKDIIRMPVLDLWKQTHKYGGINKTDFFKYYEGTDLATGILFEKSKKFKTPITLNFLINNSNFKAPQSYINLNLDLIKLIEEIKVDKILSNQFKKIRERTLDEFKLN